MKSVWRYAVPTAMLILLSGCIPPQGSIRYTKEQLSLKAGNIETLIPAHEVDVQRKYIYALTLTQKILKTKQRNLLVYEEARIESDYEFRQTLENTIDVVFDTHHKVEIMSAGGLYAYQLTLPDKGVVNLIAVQEGLFTIKFLYGMDNKQFVSLIKRFHPGITVDTIRKPLLHYTIADAVVSKWDLIKVQFYPLVSRAPRLSMRY